MRDLTQHLTTRADDNHAPPVSKFPEGHSRISIPALIKAYRIQEKAANVGFDWETREDVWPKVDEEIAEFKAEADRDDKQRMEAEMGDLLFAVVNAARLYKITPENALEKTNRKFIARFNYIEEAARRDGKKISDLTLGEMDALWNEAKKELKI